MSIQNMYDAVLALLEEHNEAIAPGKTNEPGQVDPQRVVSCLKIAGGTSIDRLKKFSYECIEDCLPEVPINHKKTVEATALAKDIAKIFRGKADDLAEVDEKRPVSSKKASRMTMKELLYAFDPEDFNSSVGQRLLEMSRGEKFIIYDDERTMSINIDYSLIILKEVKSGLNGIDSYKVENEIKRVYRVGEIPFNFVDENPIYIGRPLRSGGTCDQTGRSWEGVNENVRQLVRLIVTEEALDINIETANNLIDRAVSANAFDMLRDRYRKAALAYNQKFSTGSLPKLKVEIQQVSANKGRSPFDHGAKVDVGGKALSENYPVYNAGKWYIRTNK